MDELKTDEICTEV